LTGNLTAKKFDSRWKEVSEAGDVPAHSAMNYLDWLAMWTTQSPETLLSSGDGENELFRWRLYNGSDKRLMTVPTPVAVAEAADASKRGKKFWSDFQKRLGEKYPYKDATIEPAKTSVTAVRRRLAAEEDDATTQLIKFRLPTGGAVPRGKLSGTEIGLAHHTFLQLVSLDRVGTVADLESEAKRLQQAGFLTEEEAARLDITAIAAFWQSEIGRKILGFRQDVRRELEFTARMTPGELSGAAGNAPELFNQDFVIVQGAADLIVLLPKEIWIVDFKTDRFPASEIEGKVKLYEPQLRLYAAALSRIYHRPVTGLYLHFFGLRRTITKEIKEALRNTS
jgi:ATP-dependent helicase/nuclease subunit A